MFFQPFSSWSLLYNFHKHCCKNWWKASQAFFMIDFCQLCSFLTGAIRMWLQWAFVSPVVAWQAAFTLKKVEQSGCLSCVCFVFLKMICRTYSLLLGFLYPSLKGFPGCWNAWKRSLSELLREKNKCRVWFRAFREAEIY